MAKTTFIAAIAIGSFFANPSWGVENLPRDVTGNVIINRWIQPGESFWFNPTAWVHTYQHYCHQVEDAPKLSVDLPDPPAPESASEEAQKPEVADSATESVAEAEAAPAPEADQAPTPDQAEEPKPKTKAQKAAETKAAKAAAEAKAKAEADQAPAPDQAEPKE